MRELLEHRTELAKLMVSGSVNDYQRKNLGEKMDDLDKLIEKFLESTTTDKE